MHLWAVVRGEDEPGVESILMMLDDRRSADEIAQELRGRSISVRVVAVRINADGFAGWMELRDNAAGAATPGRRQRLLSA